jgi:hypothetical protein
MTCLRQVFNDFIELPISDSSERAIFAHGTPCEFGFPCALLAEQVLALPAHDSFLGGAEANRALELISHA